MDRLMRPAMALLACALTAAALDLTALKPQGYVSDFAGVVDAASREALEAYLKQVESATGAQIALVTLKTLDGEPIEDVANALFRQWGIGRKETHEGILLLLVIEDRKSRLEVGYGLEPYIPDGFAGSVLREMRPALRAGHYGEALLAAAETIGARIAQAKGAQLEPGPAAERRRPVAEPVPWGALAGLLVLFLWLAALGGRSHYRRRGFVRGGDLLTGILIGNLLGRGSIGYRGRSGGGFGGFDSSGGFGGFGGGDSGGGGASSNW
jgi:uncharacterized protein